MTDTVFVIRGEFASLNEYIDACRISRGRWNKGNSMKQQDQKRIMMYLPPIKVKPPVYIEYTFYCRDRRKDKDNVSGYFHKVFQDALVQAHILPNDTWDMVTGFSDRFFVDREHPRIEVILRKRGTTG